MVLALLRWPEAVGRPFEEKTRQELFVLTKCRALPDEDVFIAAERLFLCRLQLGEGLCQEVDTHF